MKNIFLISLLFVILTACTQPGSKSFIPADNRNISYIGRFDFSNKLKPVFMYSGCAIRTHFNGTSVEMVMKDDSMRNMFNVIIDDSLSIITTDKKDSIYLLAANLQDKKHTLEIIRRTEWHGGNTTFMGFRLDKGKRLNLPATKDRKVEFIGDSYTCGYGIEGKSHEDHFTYQTENNYLTFGAITARDLNAEFLTVCRSGIGVWQGYGGGKDFTMPKLYDEVIINSNKVWDYKQYVPQLVAIDLGSNDLSVALDSAKFISTYVEFLQRLRNNYPSAKIVCIAGPCSPGDEWKKTRSYIHSVVDEYKKTDNSTYYFEFSTFEPNGSDFHPNLEQHKNMANELAPFLKKLMNW
jgi:lysophospholipase L1-like esterase